MMPSLTVSKHWTETVQFYDEISPQHRQEPMKALVKEIAETGSENAVWPSHSHFTLRIFADNYTHGDVNVKASISAEYRHEVDKFHLRYHNIQGVRYDEKWCDLTEAEATLRHLFRRMRENI